MSDWTEFLLALAIFLGAHIIPARPRLRAALIARLGRRGYLLGFSLLSLGLLYWLIIAAGRAPFVPLWHAEIWQRWLVNLAMPVAIAVAVLAPGMGGLIIAFVIWSAAHLIANGDLAHLILFGVMLIFALAGMLRLRHRPALRVSLPRLAAIPVIWAVLFALHPYVIGVSPAP